jgi:hypothetical protein
LIIASIILVIVRAYAASSLTIAIVFLLALLFCTHYETCGRRIDAQLEELISDPQRVATIKDEFTTIRQQA